MSEASETLKTFEDLRASHKLGPLAQQRANRLSRSLSLIDEGTPDRDYAYLVAQVRRFIDLYGKL